MQEAKVDHSSDNVGVEGMIKGGKVKEDFIYF